MRDDISKYESYVRPRIWRAISLQSALEKRKTGKKRREKNKNQQCCFVALHFSSNEDSSVKLAFASPLSRPCPVDSPLSLTVHFAEQLDNFGLESALWFPKMMTESEENMR
jgi:hypothetical protein